MLENKWLTMAEAAELMGVTTNYVRLLLRQKKVEGQKIGERCWLVDAKSAKGYARLPYVTGRPRKASKEKNSDNS